MMHNFSLGQRTRLSVIFLLLLLSMAGCKKKESCREATPTPGTCTSVTPAGHLTRAGNLYTFRTNGGGTITIMDSLQIIITHDNYPGFKLEFWGGLTVGGETRTSANHENLNGKHIKDRLALRRTIMFPDGAKITFVAADTAGQLLSISIYDGTEYHRINPTCHALEFSVSDVCNVQNLDNAEADGETGTFEFTSTGLILYNSYTEDTPGNKINNRVNLGELETASPSLVRDYFDDPRLGHT